MAFTDDDLANVKRQHKHTSSKTECKTCDLVKRLDAAEKLLTITNTDNRWPSYYEVWRKACGVK